MDLESCPEQISDKVFQDEHSALPRKLKGGWMVNGGKGVGAGEGELELSAGNPSTHHWLGVEPASYANGRGRNPWQTLGDLGCKL